MIDFDIEKSVGFRLAKAHQRLFHRLHEELRPYGITAKQLALLAFLWKEDGLSQAELAERMESDRTTIGGMVDRLEKIGLLRREPCPGDRRAYQLYLSDRGRDLEPELTVLVRKVREELFRRFSADEYLELCRLLDKLRHE
ncbi:MAG: MarR family transcriptional regulator [Syntrophotaleaceae bacterium]